MSEAPAPATSFEPIPLDDPCKVTQVLLDSFNVEQAKKENKEKLDEFGGVAELMKSFSVDPSQGFTNEQVLKQREKFGMNMFPESPLTPFYELLIDALSDPTLIVLIAAATVSLVLGVTTGPEEERSHGWIEGAAIYFAVVLVANISAGNDYSKQLQFRALENTSAKDERTSVLRNGIKERINPIDIVVGDIVVLQAGDQVPADCIIIDPVAEVKTDESSLTGEPHEIKKTFSGDPFLISSSLVTGGEEVHAMAIGIGTHSQWGKIKANLVSEAANTPLQDKLEHMTTQIGYVGMGAAFGTFVALVISIWARYSGQGSPSKAYIVNGVVDAFILAVTIIVVAIPEGLPLAVTISLAYSTKKMYQDQCFIRVLQACETMGNATNICSDKTGTLTENRMTVVEGWFGDVRVDQNDFPKIKDQLSPEAVEFITEQSCINRSAYLVYKNAEGITLDKPAVVGNKTEGALIMMCRNWGFNYDEVKAKKFNETKDKIFSFNSEKKRSTTVLHRPDGSIRVYCKGASEWVLKDCSRFTGVDGKPKPLTAEKMAELERVLLEMADNALRTLVLAHRDFPPGTNSLPEGWETSLPDNSDLVCDCIVGIIDPLREDVKEAVADAQRAGIIVRMVTGDNVATARAIAKQCGILTEGGTSIEGPAFRKMTPAEADKILPTLQVMARSSPDDKFLLVTRLNGANLPKDKESWEKKFEGKGLTWENDRDRVLPGYLDEWQATRPEGGQVVGVTGDGTNDAPALKAADVGLAMGITGTKVAQGASDIVILDDRFSSIVRAIVWGRSVYDNIRKFLQFQLTVNVVALTVVFIGAVSGFGEPLNAVQMLWVNLVMDTMGALALGTEIPTKALLNRKPYKRSAKLISWPMIRFILSQAAFQLLVLFVLMFVGHDIFKVQGVPMLQGVRCMTYKVGSGSSTFDGAPAQCSVFKDYCDGVYDDYCIQKHHFSNEFVNDCLTCIHKDYTHGTVVFNAFIFCQLFNEFNARFLFDELNMFANLMNNWTFAIVIIITVGAQIFLVYVGGDFVKTTGLSAENFVICIAFGTLSLIVCVLSRFIPVKEDPESFFDVDVTRALLKSSASTSEKKGGDVELAPASH